MKMGVIHQQILVFQKGEDGLISKTTRKKEIIKALGREKFLVVVYNSDGIKSETERRSPAGPALLIAELGVGADGKMRLIVTHFVSKDCLFSQPMRLGTSSQIDGSHGD